MTKIKIPKSITDGGQSNTDAYKGAFWKCSNLKEIEFEEGITKIPKYLFANCNGIEKIKIPDTVTAIEAFAFYNCYNLKEVEFCENLVSIGSSTFENCSSLKKVELYDGVEYIGAYAFEKCTNLSEVKLSSKLNELGPRTFGECNSLTKIKIPKSITVGGQSNTDAHKGAFWKCSNLKEIEFEEGITKIPLYLFANCNGIEKIKIPDTVTIIENFAFYNCYNLKEIEFSKKLNEIETYAFENCSSLKKVELPDGMQVLNNSVFAGCSSLVSAYLPDSVNSMGQRTFQNCTSLETVHLPNIRQNILEYTFYNCPKLREINLPDTLQAVRSYAFYNCDSLTEIVLPSKVTVVENNAFQDCDGLTKVVIPDSVTSLGTYAFQHCDALAEVTLGTGITAIPNYCFKDCGKLDNVVLPYRVTTIGDYAYNNDVSLTKITIPRSVTSISSTAFSYPGRMTIYGISGTYAETYAKDKGIAFENKEVKATKAMLDKATLKINRGQSEKLVLTVEPSDFTDEVAWKSTNTSVVTVDDAGTVKAVNTGTAKIKVTVGNVSATCDVTVVQPVTSISLNKSSLTMEASDTFQLTASVSPASAENKKVTWTSSAENIAAVDANGLITAKKKGSAVITATAADGSGVSRSCNVTVSNTMYQVKDALELESPHPYESNCKDIWVYQREGAESITVTFSADTCAEEDFDYIYIYDKNGTEKGKYTGTQLASKSVTVMGDTIKLRLVSDNGGNEYGFKVVDVKHGGIDKPLKAIRLNKTTLELLTGETEQLSISYDPENTTDSKQAVWSSSNETVAAVEDGVVTAKEKGTAVITAQVGNYKASCQVKVKSSEKYTVRFDSDLGEEPTEITGIPDESTVELPKTPYREGYHFAGWYTEKNGQGKRFTAETPVTENLTLYAYWTVGQEHEGYIVEDIPEQTYTGTACKPEPVVRDGNTLLVLGKDYTLAYKNNVNVGTGLVTVKGKGNYTKTMTLEFSIIPKSLEDEDIELSVPDCKYTGKSCKPQPTIKWGKNTLKAGKDYTVSFRNNIEKDEADSAVRPTVTITGKGNYTGVVIENFHIYDTATSGFVVTAIEKQTYTGLIVEPVVEVYASKSAQANGEVLNAGVDYTVSYENNVKVGKGKAIITGLGQYGGSKTVTFVIQKKSLSTDQSDIVTDLDEKVLTYTGSALQPEVTVLYGDQKLTEGTDYTVKYANNVNVSADSKKVPTVTITGKGSFTGSRVLTFDIAQKELSLSDPNLTVAILDVQYTSKAVKPAVTVKDGSRVLKGGTDYTISYKNNREISNADSGTAPTVILNGKGNYSGRIEKTFRIYESGVASFVTDPIAVQEYTGEEVQPKVAVYESADARKNGEILTEGEDYEFSYENNINAGAGKIIITGVGQYGGTRTVTFTIQKKNLNTDEVALELKDSETALVYTGKALTPEIHISWNDAELTEGADYTVKYSNNVNVATSDSKKAPMATITGKGNFTGSQTLTFAIEPKNLEDADIAVTAADAKYNKGKAVKPKVIVTDENTILKSGIHYTVTYTNNMEVNEADADNAPTAVITGKCNYTGELSQTFRIYEKSISSVTVDKIPNQLYTGTTITPEITVYASKQDQKANRPLTEGVDYVVNYPENGNVKTGNGTVTITGLGEYGGTKTVKFRILPKWLKWCL